MPSDSPCSFSSAVSTDSNLDRAINEVCCNALNKLASIPHLAVLFVSAEYSGINDRVPRRVCELLQTNVLIGGTGEAIVGTGCELEGEPAVSLWLAHFPDVRVIPMQLRLERNTEGASIVGWADELSAQWPPQALMLTVGDPFSFPADLMLERLNEDRPDLCVVGGMASGASVPGESRLFLGPELLTEGAVAVMLDGPLRFTTIVSQGCRPIGRHMIVTKSEGNVVHQLGGQPSLLQLKSIFDTLATSEQKMVQQGLHVGRVVNEYQETFAQGDFLVRNVMGVDPDTGSIAVGDYLRPGQTVQFHVRDHRTADDEMCQLLAGVRDDPARDPRAALLFTCNGRGTRLFAEPHHDARLIQKYLGDIPLAGFFAAGEIGPIGGKNFMHGFTASIVFFEPAAREVRAE